MRVTSKGQVTIPRDIRELVGIEPNSEVIFSVESGRVVLTPKHSREQVAQQQRLADFLEVLDRIEGTGDQAIDGDALMAMTRDR
ncbi:AbrB/MazE/SpoVT family DNA-binding domain-containing protein [Rhizobium sp. G21]|uniref:AbrB/MazE/SpoVT family DNA-binding domain-containing protein n=1 Tax=Rhizobium sp. G21 TaxID=2758439 RepID=UPI0015FFDF5C|nr:AbrB/MazE/SpoVT family DNA-binding domain-containing protein [Rhizobium sp. G21]MBB1250158.1 AbrB/MazE/SpoVT family DNA-binding domain-containing protein [Rhizobium sp. G21]